MEIGKSPCHNVCICLAQISDVPNDDEYSSVRDTAEYQHPGRSAYIKTLNGPGLQVRNSGGL